MFGGSWVVFSRVICRVPLESIVIGFRVFLGFRVHG